MGERFLVVKLADLGDVLTATPALRALRQTYPGARIDALVTPVGATALDGLDSVDGRISFEKSSFDQIRPSAGSALAGIRLADRLRRARYDRVFLLHHQFTLAGRAKYAALLTATASPWRGGLAEGPRPFLTAFARDGGYGVKHEADYWLDVVGLAGARNLDPRLELWVGDAAECDADMLLDRELDRQGTGTLIALYPGSGTYSLARRWPAGRFGELGRRLRDGLGESTRILVVGNESERVVAAEVCARTGAGAVDLAGRTNLRTLAAVLRRCDLFIGNDGGVTHVANAVATPAVAIFGPSNHRAWGPYAAVNAPSPPPRSVVVRADLPCSPCQYRGFLPGARNGCPSRDCLDQVTVPVVLKEALRMLGR